MKTLLLILISLCFFFSSHGQKIRFTDTSNRWVVHSHEGGPPPSDSYDGFNYVSDTIINSITYKRMLSSLWGSCNGCTCAFVREDTALERVFVLMNDTEQILMDYTLSIGDSIVHKDYYNHVYIDTVIEIDSVLVNSIYHRRWYFNAVGNPWPYYVIEGIGCLYGPLFLNKPYIGLVQFDLVCFYNNGTNPPVSPPIWIESGYFDNQSSCDLAVNSLKTQAAELTIYPNPATNELIISSPNTITKVSICNMLGQQIFYCDSYSASTVKADVSSICSGFYFVKINDSELRKFSKD